jgi:hypothetical protein
MPRRIGSIAPAIVATLMLAAAVPFLPNHAARAAEECLAAPKSYAPPGRHWYYRSDRAKGRKCWYLGAAGIKTHQATSQDVPRAAPQVDKPARPLAPLGRETAGDVLPPAQVEPAKTETPLDPLKTETLATTAGAMPQGTMQWLTSPQLAAAMEREPADAPVVGERVVTDAQATEATVPTEAADAAPPRPPALIETVDSTDLTPRWMFVLIAAALAISGIVVPFRIAAAWRRRIRIGGYSTLPPPPPVNQRIPPRFDDPIAPPLRPAADDDETLRQILRRDRRAA